MPWTVSRSARRTAWTRSGAHDGERQIPEETPVALVHDASTTAVMMATPADIEDLAIGFTLTERLVDGPDAIASVDVAQSERGIEARIWLQPGRGLALAERRRHFAGLTGCGLCGIESLSEALRPPPRVSADLRFGESDVHAAMVELAQAQSLGAATRGVHAAGWWTKASGLIAVREDVGRHNALDKLAGALLGKAPVPPGLLLLTSRVSVELVQKAAVLGAEVLVAVSVPTALALREAEAAGITLIAVARSDGFEVFSHPFRVQPS